LNGPIKSSPIEDVAPFERAPFGCPRVPRRQIVESNGLISFFCQNLAGMRADIAGASRDQDGFCGSAFHRILALQTNTVRPCPMRAKSLSLQSSYRPAQPWANQVAVKPEHDLVELCEVTKHPRRISCCHTSRRDVFGNDAARADDGVAANADAG